jgi:DNA invertase Pin-like site-specific DNA recombinase
MLFLNLLVAVSGRRAMVAVLVALVAAAAMLMSGGAASVVAAQSPVLAQGAGMKVRPSVQVSRVQRVLKSRGYRLGAGGVDGRFGPVTAAAVRALQADYGLRADGLVGAKTRRLLRLVARPRRPARTTPKPSTEPKPAGSGVTPQPAQPTRSAPRPPAPASVALERSGGALGWGWLLVAIAVGAGLAALVTALLARRLRHGWQPAPAAALGMVAVSHELFLEGHSADPAVAAFRGHALAATHTAQGRDRVPAGEDTWYLVDDPRKPSPVWVNTHEIQRSPSRLAPGEPVIGYVTLAPQGQPADPEAAIAAIEGAGQAGGWRLVEVITDRENGRGLERPGLGYALRQIAEGKAQALVVDDLRRLTRSIIDLATLLAWFKDAHATLIALDLDLDTSTPTGQEIANALITLGDRERQHIAQRTRSGLAELRAQGRPSGRPAVSDQPELVARITAMRNENMTLQKIADQLNAEGVPTLRGGAMWRPSSVQAALGYRRPTTKTPRHHLPTLHHNR